MDFLLTDLPYNITLVQHDENSNQDIYPSACTKFVSKFCSEMLRPEAHGDIFCSFIQFRPWYMVLWKEVEVQEGTRLSASDSDREKI